MTLASPWLREQQRKAYRAAAITHACELAIEAALFASPKPTREIRRDAHAYEVAKKATTSALVAAVGERQ